MVENIIMIIGLCLVAAVFGKVLEKYNKEQALFLTIAAAAVILAFVLLYISPVINVINGLLERVESGAYYSSVIVKALGVCYVTQLGTDVCKDCNENALGTLVEVSGKLALTVLALPLFEKLIEVINRLL